MIKVGAVALPLGGGSTSLGSSLLRSSRLFISRHGWRVNYFRLHGGPGYRHAYSTEKLRKLQELGHGEEAYFLFNNLSMYDDALRFSKLLKVGSE